MTGLAVISSHSTTQLADFIRRDMELVALFLSWWVFRQLQRNTALSKAEQSRLERTAGLSVAGTMLCSGIVMAIIALSRMSVYEPGGKVIVRSHHCRLGVDHQRVVLAALHRLDAQSSTVLSLPRSKAISCQSRRGPVCCHRADRRRRGPHPSRDPLCGHPRVRHRGWLPAVERSTYGAVTLGNVRTLFQRLRARMGQKRTDDRAELISQLEPIREFTVDAPKTLAGIISR